MSKDFKIEPGDVVRIIAPAGKGVAANLPKIIEYIESLDLVPVMKPDIYDPLEPFYSNTDEYRGQDLLDAMLDDNCKVIWCVRGGAGSQRLIPKLDSLLPTDPPPTPKILIGYSDITALHLYLVNKYNWPTMHGIMLNEIGSGAFAPNSPTVKSLVDLLFNLTTLICEPLMTRLDNGEDIATISTEVTGGNLTLVETSIGTKWEVDATGKILFLEDTGEAGYAVERSINHMKQAGVFDGVAAVVFGDFTSPDSVDLINFALQRFADDEDIACPVFRLTGIGHGSTNFALPLNTNAEINQESPGVNAYRLCVNNISFK